MYPLKFVTPDKVLFDGEAISLIAPGGEGYMEILSHHAPIITTLTTGKITITDSSKEKHIFAISGGVMDVVGNKVRLLCDSAEKVSEIDPKRAEAAYQRAKKLLESPGQDTDVARARSALQRAEMRLKIHQESIH